MRDPASGANNGSPGTQNLNWGLIFATAGTTGPGAAIVGGAALAAEAAVVIEQEAPQIEQAVSELGPEISAADAAFLSNLRAQILEFGSKVEDLGEFIKDKFEYLYHYTTEETAALIQKSALGQPGTTLYLTPNGSMPPLQAQIELSLPQSNTAAAVFQVPTSALDISRVLDAGEATGNFFSRGGGGFEILYNGDISLQFVTRVR